MSTHLDDLTKWPGLHPKDHHLVETYRLHLHTRGYAEKTRVVCLRALWRFLKTQAEEDKPLRLHQSTSQHIEHYIATCQEQGLSPRTINHYLTLLSKCFTFLRDQGQLPSNPIHPRPLTHGEVDAFFGTVSNPRDRTIFALMLRCGLRVSEVVTLRVQDINFEDHTLVIHQTKGKKDRVVSFCQDVETLLKTSLEKRPKTITTDQLFWNHKRPSQPLSIKAVQKQIQRYAQKIGLPIHCHRLRHTFAKHLLDEDVGIVTVRDLLGHQSILSSQPYAAISNQKRQRDYFKAMDKILKEHPV